LSDPLVVCVNHPDEFDRERFRARVDGLARPVELLVAPYREGLKLRMARRKPPVPAELLAAAPPLTDELRAAWARCEVLLGLDVPPELPALAPRLRWVQAFSAGLEHLDVAGLVGRGIALTSAAGVGAAPIAEFALGRLLEVWKETRAIEQMQRERRFTRPPGRMLAGCTLGVVGLGAIGSAIAARAKALGMRVIATRRRWQPGQSSPLADELHGPDGLEHLLEVSDAVVLCAPDSPRTRDLIDAKALARMKPGAVLVNVARGTLVDEAALLAALREGRLRAAILDVTRVEPLPPGDPLWDAPNLYLSPHCSVSPDAYVERMLDFLAENVARWLHGEPLANLVTADDVRALTGNGGSDG
jgi:phosphoglycerate dehydrogenase-like enzyme